MKYANWVFLMLVFLGLEQNMLSQNESVLLKTDWEGSVSAGSIDSLIAAIKEGASIRVGWQMDLNNDTIPDLEHWVPADFLSIINGHVFNQIAPIYRQVPDFEAPQIRIMQSEMQWTGLIGTNGLLLSRFIIPNIDQFPNLEVRSDLAARTEVKEYRVWTTWARQD